MPIGATIGAAAVGAGASVYSANKAAGAAGKAADQNAQVQREMYQQTRQDLSPYAQAGVPAVNALQARLGLGSGYGQGPAAGQSSGYSSQPQVRPTSTGPAQAQGGGLNIQGSSPLGIGLNALNQQPQAQASSANPGYNLDANGGYAQNAGQGISMQEAQAILQDRPDVANSEWLAGLSSSQIGDRTGDGQVTAEDRAAYWLANYGAKEGYQAPPPPAAQQQDGLAYDIDNNGGLGPRQNITRQQFGEAQPTYNTPGGPDLSAQAFESSPYYQQGLEQGMRNLNAKFGARGLLKSGSAMEGAVGFAQDNFRNNYGQWANQQLGQWQTNLGQFNADRAAGLGQFNLNRNIFNQNFESDRARTDSIFESDRGFNTNRWDTQTGNLFNLAQMGQSAAAGQANAGQNYAAAATANNNALASVRGNAAIAGANGINNAINNGLTGYGMSQNPFGGGGGFGSVPSYGGKTPPFNSGFSGLI